MSFLTPAMAVAGRSGRPPARGRSCDRDSAGLVGLVEHDSRPVMTSLRKGRWAGQRTERADPEVSPVTPGPRPASLPRAHLPRGRGQQGQCPESRAMAVGLLRIGAVFARRGTGTPRTIKRGERQGAWERGRRWLGASRLPRPRQRRRRPTESISEGGGNSLRTSQSGRQAGARGSAARGLRRQAPQPGPGSEAGQKRARALPKCRTSERFREPPDGGLEAAARRWSRGHTGAGNRRQPMTPRTSTTASRTRRSC